MQNSLGGRTHSSSGRAGDNADFRAASINGDSAVAPRSERQLEELMDSAGIPVAEWGRGEAKDIASLWEEIETGESRLTVEDGRLTRHIRAVNVFVLYLDANDRLYELKEVRQVFKDGRERSRRLNCSISEKGKPDEDAEITARRALKEELGIEAPVRLRLIGSEQHERISNSYPGLRTQAEIVTFCAHLTQQEYRPRGYIEKGPDLTSYFRWQLVPAHLR